MINCRQATGLVSEHMERPLKFGERVELALHLLICVGCRRAERQFQFLRQSCAAWKPGGD